MAFGTLALSADNPEIDDSSVRLMVEMSTYAFTLLTLGMALFVGSGSVVILRTGVMWRWLGGLGLLIAILLIIGSAWPIDGDEEGPLAIAGFIGALATMLFIIISSINMIIRSEEPAPTERASAA
jgi:DMSO/TMAO reductase YedYZ heme-binding membrane subunit